MGQFKKKPVIIDAILWDGENAEQIKQVAGDKVYHFETSHTLRIETLEGPMTAHIGDWIIRGVKGEFYPVAPDIFDLTYQRIGTGNNREW